VTKRKPARRRTARTNPPMERPFEPLVVRLSPTQEEVDEATSRDIEPTPERIRLDVRTGLELASVQIRSAPGMIPIGDSPTIDVSAEPESDVDAPLEAVVVDVHPARLGVPMVVRLYRPLAEREWSYGLAEEPTEFRWDGTGWSAAPGDA
jgi:hypothetical protein